MKNISKLACLSLLLFGYDACASLQDSDRKAIITFFELETPPQEIKCDNMTRKILKKSEFKMLPKEELLRRMIEPELPMTMPYQSLACQVVEHPAQDLSVSAVKSPVTVMALLNSPVYKKYQDQYTDHHSDVTLGASDDTLLSQNGTVAATLSTGQKKTKKKKQPVHLSQDQVLRKNEATKTASMSSARVLASRSVLAAVVPQRTHATQSLAGGCDQHAGVGKVSKKEAQRSKKSQSSKEPKKVNQSSAQAEYDDAILAEGIQQAKNERRLLKIESLDKVIGDKTYDQLKKGREDFATIVYSLARFYEAPEPLEALQDVTRRLKKYVDEGYRVTQEINEPLENTKQLLNKMEKEFEKERKFSDKACIKSWNTEHSRIVKFLKSVKIIDLSIFDEK